MKCLTLRKHLISHALLGAVLGFSFISDAEANNRYYQSRSVPGQAPIELNLDTIDNAAPPQTLQERHHNTAPINLTRPGQASDANSNALPPIKLRPPSQKMPAPQMDAARNAEIDATAPKAAESYYKLREIPATASKPQLKPMPQAKIENTTIDKSMATLGVKPPASMASKDTSAPKLAPVTPTKTMPERVEIGPDLSRSRMDLIDRAVNKLAGPAPKTQAIPKYVPKATKPPIKAPTAPSPKPVEQHSNMIKKPAPAPQQAPIPQQMPVKQHAHQPAKPSPEPQKPAQDVANAQRPQKPQIMWKSNDLAQNNLEPIVITQKKPEPRPNITAKQYMTAQPDPTPLDQKLPPQLVQKNISAEPKLTTRERVIRQDEYLARSNDIADRARAELSGRNIEQDIVIEQPQVAPSTQKAATTPAPRKTPAINWQEPPATIATAPTNDDLTVPPQNLSNTAAPTPKPEAQQPIQTAVKAPVSTAETIKQQDVPQIEAAQQYEPLRPVGTGLSASVSDLRGTDGFVDQRVDEGLSFAQDLEQMELNSLEKPAGNIVSAQAEPLSEPLQKVMSNASEMGVENAPKPQNTDIAWTAPRPTQPVEKPTPIAATTPEIAITKATTPQENIDDISNVMTEVTQSMSDSSVSPVAEITSPVQEMDESFEFAGISNVPSMDDLTLKFSAGASALDGIQRGQLDAIIQQLVINPDLNILLRSYATAADGSRGTARRMSLARGLEIREYLMANDIRPTRVDLRALGDETDQAPIDRVDVVFTSR